jgi:hypothetical protein
MTLRGAGSSATILDNSTGADDDLDLLTVSPFASGITGGVTIRGLGFRGTGSASSADDVGVGLKIHATHATLGWITGVFVDDCTFLNTSSWGAYIVSDLKFIGGSTFKDCTFATPQRGGAFQLGKEGCGANGCTFIRCDFNGAGYGTYVRPGGAGFEVARGALHIGDGTTLNFTACSFQSNLDSGTAISMTSGSGNLTFTTCHFEHAPPNGVTTRKTHWITSGGFCGSVAFDDCLFRRTNKPEATNETGLLLLKVSAAGSLDLALFRNCIFLTDKSTDDATDDVVHNSTDRVSFESCQRSNLVTPSVQKAIRTNSPQAVVKFDMLSVFKLPHLTSTQRTALPTVLEGDMIYNVTNHTYEFHNGTAWHKMDAGVAS